MNRWQIMACGTMVLALVGCAQSRATPAGEELYHRLADRPMYCTDKKDCKEKWVRALTWVRHHNTVTIFGQTHTYLIRKLSNTFIETERVGGEPVFRVFKYPREDGLYGIEYTSTFDYGSEIDDPSPRALRASFVSYVMGLPKGVKEISLGHYKVDPSVYKLDQTAN